MKYLFDTDHVSILQKPGSAEHSKLESSLAIHRNSVCFSVVSLHEQTIGIHSYLNKSKHPADLPRGYRLLENTYATFREVPVLPFTEACAGNLVYLLTLKTRVGQMDLRIAAVAITYNLILVTRNRSDFERVPDLTIEDWSK